MCNIFLCIVFISIIYTMKLSRVDASFYIETIKCSLTRIYSIAVEEIISKCISPEGNDQEIIIFRTN